jgi:hypothetical protein
MIKIFVFISALSLTLTSCVGWGDMFAPTLWRDGNYIVKETEFNVSLFLQDKEYHSILSSRVESITQVGSNDMYIIAQSVGDKYWIIDKSKDTLSSNLKEVVRGPLKYNDFKSIKDSLRIGGLTFSKNFD